ncbi:bifunctional proline dehydrogenase/L-glutamate gamma-semialdehyde dehydrogenase PutA [Aestuariibius sp. HNIBRBA575]|uniref:bifunctional proline dehydrogenase/L-glutamate gamma-semialdehyde dehydrogenase PutA n=1 Tax=Aestuariibius sp. HNIBRBA575 TaxID=3233343 RepID=UPI0034A25B28
MNTSPSPRSLVDTQTYADETTAVARLVEQACLTKTDRATISANAAQLVRDIRGASDPGLMEVFLAEYGLSTEEGVALMCLAEALLRVPDADTIDALIEDKIAPSNWGQHLGHSSSSLVNASTWALMLTGRVLDGEKPGLSGVLRGAIKRVGEPVIRSAVARAMKEMGKQFVLGETIVKAMKRGKGMEEKGYTYSYDMLGEAARTDADARGFHLAYSRAISAIAENCHSASVAQNPGISVKLSALHARYEIAQEARVMEELVPRLRSLALVAKSAGMGLNVDAEEADRLSLSLDVIETVLADPGLKGWDGFGVVVQAYGPRASFVIDALHDLAIKLDRKIMIRLVKGAYWDAEIKRAQVEGMDGFPVFTQKAATDVSYIANARKLLSMTDRIYPQFATHNAHTVAAILHMAQDMPKSAYEFQRLHGMGETLHNLVLNANNTHCRIYAPVGAHEDLLAYLVRRLLENGANSSFVNQIVDEEVPAEIVAACPFDALGTEFALPKGPDLYQPERINSKGWDLTDRPTLARIETERSPFERVTWQAGPVLASVDAAPTGAQRRIMNPADPSDHVGDVIDATAAECDAAIAQAETWNVPVAQRAVILNKAADLYEAHSGELFALLAREAGKTLLDAVGEVREAVDFLRYYAKEAEKSDRPARGTWTCISPWNFPLAIFSGQISAALAAGNAVLAKPAEQTCLIAIRAVELLHQAGVPRSALQILPGGGQVGAALTSHATLSGVAFTGSTATAMLIRKSMAQNCAPGTPLIAETGGLNAMIVDSTALPEHAVRDILASAFQSAGQRCSALRCLYVQDDVADKILTMLFGGMQELSLGRPWALSTDVGPVIDQAAWQGITDHIDTARKEDRVLFELPAPTTGTFIAPTVISLSSILDLKREIFGPVLHVVRFKSHELDQVVADINATGFGLTFGLHTRIDDRVQQIVDQIDAGNLYVNRNQIGAIVGSQPFGGEGLSGTGPKAGGPRYVPRFQAPSDTPISVADVMDLPGPTGESNRLTTHARGPVLCLGPTDHIAAQLEAVSALGGTAISADGMSPEALLDHPDVAAAIWWGDRDTGVAYEQALSQRLGPIIALVTAMPDAAHVLHERQVCIDTTAAGGNAALLAEVSGM